MCQTSSLISQTKAGEFDLSEFRSFVPMNKTSLSPWCYPGLIKSQIPPFELGGDTVQEPQRRMRQKRWSFYCISPARCCEEITAQTLTTYRFEQHAGMMKEMEFWSVFFFFLMNDASGWIFEEKEKVYLLFHLLHRTQLCANPFNCAKKIEYVEIKTTMWELHKVYILL